MNLEEAFKAMRAGAKIRRKPMPEDEYFMACYVTVNPILISEHERESFEDMKARGQSIVWMKGERESPEMRPQGSIYDKPCKHGWYPMVNLFWLIADDWEILSEK